MRNSGSISRGEMKVVDDVIRLEGRANRIRRAGERPKARRAQQRRESSQTVSSVVNASALRPHHCASKY
jgi:hypothetical protein